MLELFELFYQSSGVCTDTRSIENGSLFIALIGENFNGNNFVDHAIEKGAKYAITSDASKANGTAIFYVDDTLVFLQQLALYHRRRFSIPVVGITGSNGKTTSKELIASVLCEKYNVLFTSGNLNNHIGVPLTLLKMNQSHEIAIIEMGANKPGDIKELVEIAEPTHGIITNIGKAHLEGFGSVEGVVKTKTELYNFIKDTNGLLVYNSDDEVLTRNVAAYSPVYTYSSTEKSNVNGTLNALTPFVHFSWSSGDYSSEVITTQLVGKYNFYNFLAAISFGKLFDVPNEKMNDALKKYKPTNNRSQVEETPKNTVILDAYNANPTSVASALESFDLIEHTAKVVVLGDMLELGNESDQEHHKIIDYLLTKNWDVILVGPIYKRNAINTKFSCYNTTDELNEYLHKNSYLNRLILVKGSRGIKLEAVMEML
jgi:UDP-N-acetylmuramoyl-tripeptide--D-alanyl-D-alanine ligase